MNPVNRLFLAVFACIAMIGTAQAQTAVDKSKVLATNSQFYSAFTAGDIKAMEQVWATKSKIGMTPPGAPFLQGKNQIMGTFALMMSRPFEIKCEMQSFEFKGERAVVICDEVLKDGKIPMMNVFGPEGEDWKMLYHGPVPKDWESGKS